MEKGNENSILIVDDDLFILDSVSMLLKEYGFLPATASNSEDALTAVREVKFDAILTDIVMPGGTGIELLSKIREFDSETPVILMTGYADLNKAVEAIKMGAFDFIIKPYKIEQLVHSLTKAVNYCRLLRMEKDYKHMLEEFNQEIETLVSERTMSLMALTLAHRIRNPVTVIGVTCRRILQKEEVTERLKDSLSDIVGETERLETIVSDFQTILKSRQSVFEYRDINETVKSVVSVLERDIGRKGISLNVRLSAIPLSINVQKNLLRIAVFHVAKNAFEATPEGGTVTIQTFQDGERIYLRVSDTGCGIPENELEKVFDPLYSRKQRFGMGLPLVKQIVSEHLGELKVESTVGKGTIFTMIFPSKWMGKEEYQR